METTRAILRGKIEDTKRQIIILKAEFKRLQIEELMFSDSERQYKTELTTKKYLKGKKWKPDEENLVGSIVFFENFKDEDTGEIIPIERTPPVMINNDWSRGLSLWAYNPDV